MSNREALYMLIAAREKRKLLGQAIYPAAMSCERYLEKLNEKHPEISKEPEFEDVKDQLALIRAYLGEIT